MAATDDPRTPDAPPALPEAALPVLWLLGKTGAGKSSLVRVLTEQSAAQVGDGFRPCTRTAQAYDFPTDQPLLRFLDTRGLGEAGYDPAEDLAQCRGRAHLVLAVCRLDDPVQGEVADVLADVARRDGRMRAILVLTGADLLEDEQALARARGTLAARFDTAAGRPLPQATLALGPDAGPDAPGLAELRALLVQELPAVGLALEKERASTAEEAAFQAVRRRVLFFAGLAGSSDVAPLVGAVSVPATQLAMLRDLAGRYGVPWDRKTMLAFAGAMGMGLAARYAAAFGLRQAAKLIPVVGWTLGAAAAGSLSFAATYALGRAAAYFLHARAAGTRPDEAALRRVYARALNRSSDETP